MVGLQPMAWWFIESPREYLARPASLYTGGVGVKREDRTQASLGAQLFGTSMHGEEVIGKDPENLSGFLREFCLQTVPWFYLNQHERLSVELTPQLSTATFSGDLISRVDRAGRIVITEHRRTLRERDDILFPASWLGGKSLIAYSANGVEAKRWDLPPDWKQVRSVKVEEITLSGPHRMRSLEVINHRVTLTLQPDHALLLTPAERCAALLR
jgi:hypothetical protein